MAYLPRVRASAARGGVVSATDRRVIIESPLAGDFGENFRYLLWCCRAVYKRLGKQPIASHLVCPWFMDDRDPDERRDGIDSPWVWDSSAPHYVFDDLGMSNGMQRALERCKARDIEHQKLQLAAFAIEWAGFMAGNWPPHTPGFELLQYSACARHRVEEIGRGIYWCPICGAFNRDTDGVWRMPKAAT